MSKNEVLSLKDKHSEAAEGEILKQIYAVRWFEHEYEAGYGVTDRESEISVHTSLEEAEAFVQKCLKIASKQVPPTLVGAGDFFEYPAGDHDAFDVCEVWIPASSNIFDELAQSDNGTTFLYLMRGDEHRNLIQSVKNAWVNAPEHEKHTKSCPGFSPKPEVSFGYIPPFHRLQGSQQPQISDHLVIDQ